MSRTRSANGRSSVYRDSSGIWHGWVSMGRDEKGKPVRRHVRGRTRAVVSERVADLERERASSAGLAAANPRQTPRERRVEGGPRPKAPPTAPPPRSPDALIRTHCQQLRSVKLHEVTVRHIDDLLHHVATTVSPTTAGNLHRTLRSAFTVAVRRGLVSTNPCRYATVPRVAHVEVEPLSVAEVHRLLSIAAGERNAARWAVALALGLRQGEALALQWSDIDLENGTLAVRRQLQRHPWEHGCVESEPRHPPAECPQRHSGGLRFDDTKSGAGRRVLALPPQMVPQLLDHRRAQAAERLAVGSAWEDHDLVFPRPGGGPADPRNDHRVWKRLLARAEIREARLHDARHTAATILLAQGVDGRVVMSLMGWSQAVLLTRYQHVMDTMRVEAAAKVGTAIWGD